MDWFYEFSAAPAETPIFTPVKNVTPEILKRDAEMRALGFAVFDTGDVNGFRYFKRNPIDSNGFISEISVKSDGTPEYFNYKPRKLNSFAPIIGGLALGALTGGIGLVGAGALGLSGAAAGAAAGAIGGGLSSAATGNDIGKGILLGGITGGVGASLPGVASSVSNSVGGGTVGNALGNAARSAITGGVSSALQGGDIGTGFLLGGINGGANSLITSGINSFRDPVVADSAPTNAVNDKFGPVDYSLSSGSSGPGLKLTNGGAGFTQGLLDDGFGVGLLDQPVMSQPGLKAPDLPNLLGVGAPGLSVSVPGGKVSAVGFVPKNASPTLGNPSSIVNNPNALGTPVLGDGKVLTQSTPAPSVPAPKTNVNVAGLLGLGGAALGGLLSDGGGSDIKPQRYGLTGQTFNYDGDLDTYGQTATGDFRFYRPTMGLLG